MTKDQQIEELQNQVSRLLSEAEANEKELEDLKEMAYYLQKITRSGYIGETEDIKMWYRDLYNIEMGKKEMLSEHANNLSRIIDNLINPKIMETNEETNHKAFVNQ